MNQLKRKPQARQVRITEYAPGVYKTFLRDMASYRTFGMTVEQFEIFRNTEFNFETAHQIAMPFEQFALTVGPGFIPFHIDTAGLRIAIEGITCEVQNDEYIITTTWLAVTDDLVNHVVTAVSIAQRSDGLLNLDDMHYGTPPVSDDLGPGTAGRFALQGAKVLLHFLYALDHRKVKITERIRSRAERRADEKLSGVKPKEHYEIYIPPMLTMAKIHDDLSNSRELYSRIEYRQEVRGHLRRDKYGRKRIRVRQHERFKDLPWRTEDHHNHYAAHNVGMEPDSIEL
jgi:hypothetical protein